MRFNFFDHDENKERIGKLVGTLASGINNRPTLVLACEETSRVYAVLIDDAKAIDVNEPKSKRGSKQP